MAMKDIFLISLGLFNFPGGYLKQNMWNIVEYKIGHILEIHFSCRVINIYTAVKKSFIFLINKSANAHV